MGKLIDFMPQTRRLKLLLGFAAILFVLLLVQWPISPAFKRYREAAEKQHIRRVREQAQQLFELQTNNLPQVDRVQVYLLGTDATDGFPIRPYKSYATIRKEVTLTDVDANEVADLWRSREFGHWGYLCHYPLYGLRFYSDKKLLFETSLCWKCSNFYSRESSDDYVWMGFSDPKYELLNRLKQLCTE